MQKVSARGRIREGIPVPGRSVEHCLQGPSCLSRAYPWRGQKVYDHQMEVLLEPFCQERAMAGRGFALYTEQGDNLCVRAELFDKLAAVESSQALGLIACNEQLAQGDARAFTGVRRFIC